MTAPQPPASHDPEPVRFDVPSAGGAYPVTIASGSSRAIAATLDDTRVPARRLIVSSPTVWRLHGEPLGGLSADDPILIPDGERFKHLGTVGRIYEALIRAAADRSTALIAVGGGVVGDVAGFAAATYLRGIPVVQVPTTLLAQVDSAIGGKVGVNHALGKNLIGAFHSPAAVVIDPDLLPTLPRREFRAGLYEVVKYGVIASRPLFDTLAGSLKALFAREPGALVPVIAACCRIKAAVVTEDEREAGPRRALNFGHTAGHALEAVTKYRRFRHGEAVAYGMRVAAEIGVRRRTMTAVERDALASVITQMGPLPPIGDLSAGEVVEAMRRDKKVAAGRLHFVLPAGIGRTIVADDVGEDELAGALVRLGLTR
jgi:3-dehydroquinate synthase